MSRRFLSFLLCLGSLSAPVAHAAAPVLLATALQRWHVGEGEWAFTQHTRVYHSDGTLKEERVERYDPSLPDSQRWRLLEVDGQPATPEAQVKWDGHKNGKPRKRVDRGGPADFLDLEHATLVGETPRMARYKIAFKPDASHFVDLDEVEIVVAVNKETDTVSGVGATLREPMRVLLGLAKITHLDVDLHLGTVDEGSVHEADDIQSGSTASVKISKLGRPVEYDWSDFKRVPAFAGP
jgi:hypothetical protein